MSFPRVTVLATAIGTDLADFLRLVMGNKQMVFEIEAAVMTERQSSQPEKTLLIEVAAHVHSNRCIAQQGAEKSLGGSGKV